MPRRERPTSILPALENVLEAAEIGFLELSEGLMLRHASPAALKLLGTATIGSSVELDSLLISSGVREWIGDKVLGQLGAVTNTLTPSGGDVVIATAAHHPAEARVFCLLQRPAAPPEHPTAELLE